MCEAVRPICGEPVDGAREAYPPAYPPQVRVPALRTGQSALSPVTDPRGDVRGYGPTHRLP
jgi:hypothetical protein